MSAIKLLGFLFSVGLIAIVITVVYKAGKSDFAPRQFYKLPEQVLKDLRFPEDDQRFRIKIESFNWPLQDESGKIFEPINNPCQIKWIVTMNSIKGSDYHSLYYLMPRTCSLNDSEILFVQFKILSKINQQIDFKHVEKVELFSKFYIDGLFERLDSFKVILEKIVGREVHSKIILK